MIHKKLPRGTAGVDDIIFIDVMNHPWEANRRLWLDNFEYDDFRVMGRTTFKTVFGGETPTGQALLDGGVFGGHDSVAELVDSAQRLDYEHVVMTATKMWSPYWHHQLILDYPIEQVAEIAAESDGIVIGAASYNPFRIEHSLAEVERAVRELGFRYVWFHPLSFGLPPNDRRCYPLYAKCIELDIAVGMQVGHSAEPMPSDVGRPMLVDAVALDFPSLRINLSHTGWPWVDEWCSMLWKHENVYGDISAYFPRSLDERLVRFMDSSRGRDKVLFGTNGLGLKPCRDQFLALPIRDDTKRMVAGENARRFLKLPAD